MNKNIYKLMSLFIMLNSFSTLSCAEGQYNRKFFCENSILPIGAVSHCELPDSAMRIIINAQRIVATRYTYDTDNSPIVSKQKKLNSEQMGALKMAILSAGFHPMDSAIVFGLFSPKVSFLFLFKNERCTLTIDYSLHQASLLLSEQHNYIIQNEIMLKEAVILFPNDTFLNELLQLIGDYH